MRIEEVIGQNIGSRRKALDISQEELGRRLGEVLGRAWPRQTVFTAEKGGRNFTASELVALALVLGIAVERLFRLPLGVKDVELSSGHKAERWQLELVGTMVGESPAAELYEVGELIDVLSGLVERRAQEQEEQRLLLVKLRDRLDQAIGVLATEWTVEGDVRGELGKLARIRQAERDGDTAAIEALGPLDRYPQAAPDRDDPTGRQA